jgi:DHA2 family multidrug resistance protein
LILIPINTTAISSLSPSDVGQGASFLALGRQIGGSFGIAILATYLNSHLQTNRSLLINHINNSNPLLNNRVAEITSGFVNNGLTYVNAHNAALGLIDRAVSTQAAAMSYNDTFQLLAIIGVVTMPAIFMLSKPSSNQAMAMK